MKQLFGKRILINVPVIEKAIIELRIFQVYYIYLGGRRSERR